MKNIRIVREKQDNCRFNIESYYFVEYESNIHPLPIYPITLNISSLSPIDVRLLLEEVSSSP